MHSKQACSLGAADDWDIDVLRAEEPDRIKDTLAKCAHCPMISACLRYTEECVKADKPPKALVQAGRIFNAAGGEWTLDQYFSSVGGFQGKLRVEQAQRAHGELLAVAS